MKSSKGLIKRNFVIKHKILGKCRVVDIENTNILLTNGNKIQEIYYENDGILEILPLSKERLLENAIGMYISDSLYGPAKVVSIKRNSMRVEYVKFRNMISDINFEDSQVFYKSEEELNKILSWKSNKIKKKVEINNNLSLTDKYKDKKIIDWYALKNEIKIGQTVVIDNIAYNVTNIIKKGFLMSHGKSLVYIYGEFVKEKKDGRVVYVLISKK